MRELDLETVALEGAHLVEASAGCGKTFSIARLYERLVVESKLDVSQILVVTYTRAATAELRERIRSRLRDAAAQADGTDDEARKRLETALRSFDDAAVFTIHGFCQRALADNAFESRVEFDVELATDLGPLLQEVVEDFWIRELYDAPRVLVEHLRAKGMGPAELAGLARAVTADPEMPVLPDRPAAELERAEEAWRETQREAADEWKVGRAEVVSLLCDFEGFHRNSYNVDRIREVWLPAIDAMTSAHRPGTFDKLDKLTPDGMRLKKGYDAPAHRFFDACARLHAAEQALTEQLDRRVLAMQLDLVRFARGELARRKDEQRTQGFDDLLHRLHGALRSEQGDALLARLRDRYRAALIDEFQDTDPVQFDIFRRAFSGGGRPLFLIGDPKQAIYAFRGADVFAYLEAAKSAADERHTLSTNWRSDPSLVRAVNAVFTRARAPFLVPEIRYHEVRPREGAEDALSGPAASPFEILLVDGRDDRVETSGSSGVAGITKTWADGTLPKAVASEIVRLLSSGTTLRGSDGTERQVEPGDIAVLCRTNRQAADVQAALRELRVPAVLEGDRSVFETDEAADVERLLVAMASPRDATSVRAALATPILGVSGDELCRLRQDENDWERWLSSFDRYERTFREEGFVQAFRLLLREQRVVERLLERTDGERRLTNVLHVGELLHEAATRHHLGPQALVRWLEQMRRDQAARGEYASEAAQIRLESDARAVRLTTIHKSKGLEYPIVYCPFLWDGKLLFEQDQKRVRFHDADDDRRVKLDLGSVHHADHLEEARREALAENLRLVYVALTRAKHRCSLVWGKFRASRDELSALGYLLHPAPGEGLDPIDAQRTHLASLSDEALRAELGQLEEAAAGAIRVRELPLDPAAPWSPPAERRGALTARVFDRAVDRSWRVSSFSGLTSAAESEAESFEAVVARDPMEEAPAEAAPPEEAAPVTLHEFPAGPRPGLLLHEIYEHLDFEVTDDGEVRALVERTLGRYGFEGRWLEPVCRSVREMLDTPLAGGLRLADVPRSRRLDEMEFTFPVRSRLTAEALGQVFARHSAPAMDPAYAQRVARLGFATLHGHLRGFVDLAFEHDGRWWLVDYKSNRLGDLAPHYAPDRLAASMADHHYYLQYHLYVAALHRHLTSRLPGWDYERGFGGVRYLFVRGMAPGHPQGTGVFADRPSLALVEDLVATLDGGSA